MTPTRTDMKHKINVYSWAATVDFVLGSEAGFHDLAGDATLLWGPNYILGLESVDVHPKLEGAGLNGYRFKIEAENTASGAETLGARVAFGLLSVAVQKGWGLSLSWPEAPLPCRVVNRTVSLGPQVRAFGTVLKRLYLGDFITELETSFHRYQVVPERLLLSMELVCLSRLENSNRSKLILLISALEALAIQRDFTVEIGGLVQGLVSVVDEFGIEDESLKSSLIGQIQNLNRESIRRAISRLLSDNDFSNDDAVLVEEAYIARSAILHEGKRVPELSPMIVNLEKVLIQIYRIGDFSEGGVPIR